MDLSRFLFKNKIFYLLVLIVFVSTISCSNTNEYTNRKFLSSFKSEIESKYNCILSVWKEEFATKAIYTLSLEYPIQNHSELPNDIEYKSELIAHKFIENLDVLDSKMEVVINHDLVRITKTKDYTSTKVIDSFYCNFTIGVVSQECSKY